MFELVLLSGGRSAPFWGNVVRVIQFSIKFEWATWENHVVSGRYLSDFALCPVFSRLCCP